MISEELTTYFNKADNFKMLKSDQQSIVQYSMKDYDYMDKLYIKDHMLMFVIEGNQAVITPNFLYKLESGEAIFVKKGSIILCEKLKKDSKLQCVLFFFTDEYLSKFIKNYREMLAPSELLNIDSINAYQFCLDSWMKSYLNSVSSYFEITPEPVAILIQKKIEELLLLLITGQERSYFMSFLKECLKDEHSSIETVVNTNMYRNLNVDHLAHLSNLSLSQFKREFNYKYNDSPASWLRKKRLEKSTKLLLTTNLNINEICYDSGFNNVSHFCKLFQKHYQISPLKYRGKLTT